MYDNTLFTINKILNQSGVNSSYLDDKPIQLLEQRSVEWFLPTLYISYSLYIENKELYEVALELIKEYILRVLPILQYLKIIIYYFPVLEQFGYIKKMEITSGFYGRNNMMKILMLLLL